MIAALVLCFIFGAVIGYFTHWSLGQQEGQHEPLIKVTKTCPICKGDGCRDCGGKGMVDAGDDVISWYQPNEDHPSGKGKII